MSCLRRCLLLVSCSIGLTVGLTGAASGARPQAQAGGDSRTIVANGDAVSACYRFARRGVATDEAIRTCTRAMETATTPLNRTASTVNRGVVLFNAAEYERAVADFTTAIEAHRSRNPRVFVNRGLSYEQARPGDPAYEARARADYETALSISPASPTAKRRLKALERPFIERRPLSIRTIT